MLQLFNVTWSDITKKMPEIAEAGYDSIWLPPPTKASSVYSTGYDEYDSFDLGDTSPTRWGTKAQLQQLVQTAHRFGVRIYLDNIMNHRGFTVPGYNSSVATNFYPGLVPQDFHLQTVGIYFANWPSVGSGGSTDWNDSWKVQYQPLAGLIDLANEPGSVNGNFGSTMASTITKPSFIRHPGKNQLYMDTSKPVIEGSFWRPFNGTNGTPVVEDVNSYLIRSILWELNETKCDGFRLDAVKHVPAGFFGDSSATFNGYCGAVQAMFDYVHGYGTNVLGNGYLEPNDSRDSCFNSEEVRNDALIFGEHLGNQPPYGDYIAKGMRLLNAPLRDQMNNALNGSASLVGADAPGYVPYSGAIDPRQSVMFAQSHDASGSYAAHRELQNAYYFMHEGTSVIYSDGYNWSSPTVNNGSTNYFPSIAYANYLGEYGDNQMPDICYLHNQLARGYTVSRWNENNYVAFERYDYREGTALSNQAVVLFAMNDNYGNPGDVYFVDGSNDILPSSYAVPSGGLQGLVVDFPVGSVLRQLATSTPGYDRTFKTVTVRIATNGTPANSNFVYVRNQIIPAGGGAIEMMIPSGGWVMYGYQWPEASRANPSTNAIVFKQSGKEVPHITINRTDGVNGDAGYNPTYPFKMRGSVDQYGNTIGGVHVSNLTYAIDVPIVTNANFDILVRNDASSVNTLVKLDGGIDLNSQMGLGVTNLNGKSSDGFAPTNFLDLRDNKPGYASDVFLGYEQTAFQFRNGPEKFAAKNTLSNAVVSLGAETYYYTVGSTNNLIVSGSGYGQSINNATCYFNYHDPAAPNTATNNSTATQRVPLSPTNNQPTDIYVQIGDAGQVNTCYIYYTTDGTNPEGDFGSGKGTTQVTPAFWVARDSGVVTKEWWKGTIPAQIDGTQVRYKVGIFNGGSYGFSVGNIASWPSILPISDAEASGSKLYGMTQAAITNFNPTTAVIWLHNDLNTNNTTIGLQSGFHIVRARAFLPRTNQSSVFNTFLQTFYYDGALPTGVIAYPMTDGTMITNTSYTVVVRADSTVTGVDYNFQDSLNTNTAFYTATNVLPNSTIDAQYPNYPQEFRFIYTNVPFSGTGIITVRLKEFATSVYTNRFTTLVRTVNTIAPPQVIQISSPSTDGAVLTNSQNSTYLVQACFTSTLTPGGTNFNVLINGVLQPQVNYFFQNKGANNAFCPGFRTLQYNWSNPSIGTNVIQVIYTNTALTQVGVPISDTRIIMVAPPLKISGLSGSGVGNKQVVWDSALGALYKVLATTNLSQPFQDISGPVSGAGGSTFFFDTDTNTPQQKFYEIQML